MWTDKGKGKTVAGPSEKPATRFVELVSDDEDDGDVDFELAMVAPEPALPKGILKRSASSSELSHW